MNLSEVIHQRWAAAATLENLLPASRVYTGLSVDPATPYAAISKISDRPTGYHNDGSAVTSVAVRIEVFHDDYDSAVAIVDQVVAAFDRSDFALAGADKVINVQRSNDFHQQEDDGTWRMVIDFNCTVHLA